MSKKTVFERQYGTFVIVEFATDIATGTVVKVVAS